MRRLLDYTHTGRWLTLVADPAAAQADQDGCRATDQQALERTGAQAYQTKGVPAAPIRRLLEYTISGHWRARDEAPLEPAASDDEQQLLCDAAFFGLEVKEIPAEKWREIAPLFRR